MRGETSHVSVLCREPSSTVYTTPQNITLQVNKYVQSAILNYLAILIFPKPSYVVS